MPHFLLIAHTQSLSDTKFVGKLITIGEVLNLLEGKLAKFLNLSLKTFPQTNF